jgi:hypothetical protein
MVQAASPQGVITLENQQFSERDRCESPPLVERNGTEMHPAAPKVPK